MKETREGLGFRLSSKRLPKQATQQANRFLNRLFGFDTFNEIFRALPECSDSQLMQTALDAMNVRVERAGAPLEAIPRSGPLVVVCNHPFGIVDGLAIGAILQSIRADASLLTAHWLSLVPRFRTQYLIVVGAQGAGKRRRQSVAGWLTALQRLKGGEAVVIFPAGRVARLRWARLSVADAPWSPHVASVIRKTSAQVIPVFFAGGNSRAFYALSAALPALANFLLAREFLKKKNATLRVVVGQAIAPAKLASFDTDQAAIDFLRAEVERLGR
jgi:putative hemolysin